MASVTARINQIKQPRGGFIKPSDMVVELQNDGIQLNHEENVHASIVGMSVDYLTRFMNGATLEDAFGISLRGAQMADSFGVKGSLSAALKMLHDIKGLDDASIVNASKLVTFDVWFRNPQAAMMSKTYKETNPDKATVENIRTMVNRSMSFFKKYGPVTKDGFTFEPVNGKESDYQRMCETKKGSWGGYTGTVESGDGDFLTKDTIWDFKVSKAPVKKEHTLQLLMYWRMGLHSIYPELWNIQYLGIYNPRLNTAYRIAVTDIPEDVIEEVEVSIIGYKNNESHVKKKLF